MSLFPKERKSAKMRLFDSHCHLSDSVYYNNLEDIIAEALTNNVRKILSCSTCEKDWERTLVIVNEFPDTVIGAIGIHPWFVSDVSADFSNDMEHILKENPFLSVGEIGLDFALSDFEQSKQEDVFKVQLEIAKKLERPVSIHCIKAWDSFFSILNKIGPLPAGGILHSFSGSLEVLDQVMSLGLKPSFSAGVLNDNNKKLSKILNVIGKESLIIETDSPAQVPYFVDEGCNRPKNLTLVAKALADRFFTDLSDIAHITYKNASDIFDNI